MRGKRRKEGRTSFDRTGLAKYESIPLSMQRSRSPLMADAVSAMMRTLLIRGSGWFRMAAVAA